MEKGAASPGRWQVTQCFCRIGETSLVNVGGGFPGSCPRANPTQNKPATSITDRYFMNVLTSEFELARRERDGRRNPATAAELFPFVSAICRRIVTVEGESGKR